MQQMRYVVKKSPMFYFEKEKLFRPMIITHDNLHVWPCLEPGASTAFSKHQVLRRGLGGRHLPLARPVRDRQSCFWEGED